MLVVFLSVNLKFRGIMCGPQDSDEKRIETCNTFI